MNYYLIFPNALIGHFFNSLNRNRKVYNLSIDDSVNTEFTIFFQVEYSEEHFFIAEGNVIVSEYLKKQIEGSTFKNVKFKRIDKVIRGYMVDENGKPKEGAESYASEYWVLFPLASELNGSHFFKFGSDIVVSEIALNFLKKTNSFHDTIAGLTIGKDYEVLTNRIKIEGELREFFVEKLPKIRSAIRIKEKKIMQEYRRIKGLPPLH